MFTGTFSFIVKLHIRIFWRQHQDSNRIFCALFLLFGTMSCWHYKSTLVAEYQLKCTRVWHRSARIIGVNSKGGLVGTSLSRDIVALFIIRYHDIVQCPQPTDWRPIAVGWGAGDGRLAWWHLWLDRWKTCLVATPAGVIEYESPTVVGRPDWQAVAASNKRR